MDSLISRSSAHRPSPLPSTRIVGVRFRGPVFLEPPLLLYIPHGGEEDAGLVQVADEVHPLGGVVVKFHDAVQVGGGHQHKVILVRLEQRLRPLAQILLRPDQGVPNLAGAAEHGALGDQKIHRLRHVLLHHPFHALHLPRDAVVPEVPGEQDGLACRLDAEHIGVQGGVVHVEGQDPDAGNGCHPIPHRLVGPHLFHDGTALFRRVPVDVGDQDAQDVLGQGADVHGNTRRNFFEQAVVVAVVVGEQNRAVLAGAEHLLDHLTVLRLGISVRPWQIGPKVDEDAVSSGADLGAAAADLVGAAMDGQARHIISLPFPVNRWRQ